MPFPPFNNLDRRDPIRVKARVQVLLNHSAHQSTRGLDVFSQEDRQEFQNFMRRLLEPNASIREGLDRIVEDKWFEDRKRSDNFYSTVKL